MGYKFNFHNDWIDNMFDTTLTGTTENAFTTTPFTGNTGVTGFTSGNTLASGTTLVGAFVEYNDKGLLLDST